MKGTYNAVKRLTVRELYFTQNNDFSSGFSNVGISELIKVLYT